MKKKTLSLSALWMPGLCVAVLQLRSSLVTYGFAGIWTVIHR
jgi:hypothetical protein